MVPAPDGKIRSYELTWRMRFTCESNYVHFLRPWLFHSDRLGTYELLECSLRNLSN